MIRGIFVCGTDTGVGKTRVAAALLRGLAADGIRAVGMKPVASGIEPGAEWNEDVLALRAASDAAAVKAARPEDLNPYAFVPAIAPHLASAQAGSTIDIEVIDAAARRLAGGGSAVVVEGAGGALVPLSSRSDMLDIAVALRLPVLLVVGVRLGCINHALLSALAIRSRGLMLSAWVANRIDPTMAEADANVATLERALAAPLLADLPWSNSANALPIAGLARMMGWSGIQMSADEAPRADLSNSVNRRAG